MFCTESNKLSSVCPRYKRKQGAEPGRRVRSELETVTKGSPFGSVKRVQRESIVAGEGYGRKRVNFALKYWDMFICIWESILEGTHLYVGGFHVCLLRCFLCVNK